MMDYESGARFRVQGARFRVQGSGFRESWMLNIENRILKLIQHSTLNTQNYPNPNLLIKG
jgi:hypothetical protein